MIQANHSFGIRANGQNTYANTWSQNQIFANLAGGISLALGANGNINAPLMLTVLDKTISGKTLPNARVEVFADLGVQGQYQEGEAEAGNDGSFVLTIAGSWQSTNLTAITIDSSGNASVFSAAIASPATPTPMTTLTDTPTATPTATLTTPTDLPETQTPTSTATVTGPTTTSTPTPTLTNTPGPGAEITVTPVAGSYHIHLPIVRR